MSVLAGLAAWVVLMLVTGAAGRGVPGSLLGVLLAGMTLSDRHLVAGLAVATSLSYVVGAVLGVVGAALMATQKSPGARPAPAEAPLPAPVAV
jgi:hypothetical protein